MIGDSNLVQGVLVTAVCAGLWIRRPAVFDHLARQQNKPVNEKLFSICFAGGAVGGLLIVLGSVLPLFG